mmetsp:Transcript_106574/g.300030  ORF Transcript_106574/g.300030 Transcript_106574/m.300030 type:complete len:736 (+) Transcript_106574:73-2280(+)
MPTASTFAALAGSDSESDTEQGDARSSHSSPATRKGGEVSSGGAASARPLPATGNNVYSSAARRDVADKDDEDEEEEEGEEEEEEEDDALDAAQGGAEVVGGAEAGSQLHMDVVVMDIEQVRNDRGVQLQMLPDGKPVPSDISKPVLYLDDLAKRGVPEALVSACKSCARGARLASAIQAEVWGVLLCSDESSALASACPGPEDIPIPDSDDDLEPTTADTKPCLQPSSSSWCRVRDDFDIIGVAPTGSGKTLAFLLPVIADGLLGAARRISQLPDMIERLSELFSQSFPSGQGRNIALLDRLRSMCEKGDAAALRPILEQVAAKAAPGDAVVSAGWRSLLDDCAGAGLLQPLALVLSPTRELAQQVGDVAALLGAPSMVILGGVDHHKQREALLQEAPLLLVATPGRLLALCGRWPSSSRLRQEEKLLADPVAVISLRRVRRLVLDEADRLLDEGFEEDIRELSGLAVRRRQTMLFSATWSKQTQCLAASLRPEAVHIAVSGVPPSIEQKVQLIPKVARGKRLREILGALPAYSKVLVFVLYKKEASELARMLAAEGRLAWSLQGDMSQGARTVAMQSFRNASGAACTVLVATDVAARGLDVPDVTHVINFSFGLSPESYVHRIGRCGRAGRRGQAITFVTEGDERFASHLLQVLRAARQPIPKGLVEMAELYESSQGSAQLAVQWDKAGEIKVVVKGIRAADRDSAAKGDAAKPAKGRGKTRSHAQERLAKRH